MSVLKLGFNFHSQWLRHMATCKAVAKTHAALPENASDPFSYARMIKDLQFGYVELPVLQEYISGKLKFVSKEERVGINERVKVPVSA